MNKGMITALVAAVLLLPLNGWSEGQIYKVVDEDGNVTFTDQKPSSNAEPVDLPPLSVIKTDTPPPSPSLEPAAAPEEENCAGSFGTSVSPSRCRRRPSGVPRTRSSLPGAVQPKYRPR